MSKVVIIGTGKTSEIIYQYLKPTHDIIGFADSNPSSFTEPRTRLPIFDIADMKEYHWADSVLLFVAIASGKLNTIRQIKYEQLKKDGWKFLTYIHPRATVASTVTIGENCIVMEENVIQDFVDIGNNNIFWSGNHIGHHTSIGHNNFISSHVVISGNCKIGDNNFFGVNSCIGDNVEIGNFNWFSPLTSTTKNIGNDTLFRMPKSIISEISTKEYFKV
jgi:sugar O-acyltransferase (sialic acid O-acetyltransferase NeuD family)